MVEFVILLFLVVGVGVGFVDGVIEYEEFFVVLIVCWVVIVVGLVVLVWGD